MAINFHPLSHILLHLLTITNLIFISNATEKADHYIVHMDLTSMPAPFADQHSWYKSTLASISTTTTTTTTTSSSPPPPKLVYSYTHAITGFSATLTVPQLSALKHSPGFLHSTRDSSVTLHTTHTSNFLGLGPTSGLWPASHYGNDVIIGVVDSGVWPESKSFSDDGTFPPIPSKWRGTCQVGTDFNSSMCNNKLIGARYFNKGLLASYPFLHMTKISARDTEGHGTHTSSTAAGSATVDEASYFGYANGKPVGMAPRARVAVYKALWQEGSSTADVIAAIDKAISDGVDVLSISLTTGYREGSFLDDVIAIATFAAVKKGIFVSLSAGNNGPERGTLHNGTPWALTVAAGTTDRLLGGTITLGNRVSVNGVGLYPETVAIKNAPLTFMKDCSDWDAIKRLRNDTVVVCLESHSNGSAVLEQVGNVQSTSVAMGIFITSYADLVPFIQSPFPAIYLDLETGKTVINYLNTSPVKPTVTVSLKKTILGSKIAPKVAPYSSRGPSNTCRVILKPDLMAPGDQIIASWSPLASVTEVFKHGELFNNFNIMSGTSMACPHAAGVAALLKGAYPEWTPAMIRSAMMTTADTLDNSGQPIKDFGRSNARASALAMGAGHINPNKAMEPGLVYDATYQDYMDLLCALNYTETQIRVFVGSSVKFRCSPYSTPVDLNYPSFMVIAPGGSRAFQRVFWRTVTNVGEAATYIVKVDMDVGGVEVRVKPTRIVFRKMYEKARFKVIVNVDKKIDKEDEVDGSICWVHVKGKYLVRSPILITTDS